MRKGQHVGVDVACCRTWALWRAAATRGNLLPYVGPGWYPKVSLAAMLDLGVCRWDHIVLGISARSHVDAATLRRALERMDAAWPEGEERMAKLSVNAMIGLWARSTEVVYSVRSSSSELDGAGADFSQAFAYEGVMVWWPRPGASWTAGAGEDGLPADAAAAEGATRTARRSTAWKRRGRC